MLKKLRVPRRLLFTFTDVSAVAAASASVPRSHTPALVRRCDPHTIYPYDLPVFLLLVSLVGYVRIWPVLAASLGLGLGGEDER